MACLRTQIDLLRKHIVSKFVKVNVVGQQSRCEEQDTNIDEEANYFANQGGFLNNNSRHQGYYSRNTGQNCTRDGNYDRPTKRKEGKWQNKDGH